ncbi:unnamed protein product [Cuscuta europaea]|uniref:Xylanase inhibitor N-terminal domain-containing protein n=1 Tax=Cuscuta europaea TaxID=41803 RepID=A0A9P1DXP8_CUSEU|nr:unnamed protein product [Cuscuta europaea]
MGMKVFHSGEIKGGAGLPIRGSVEYHKLWIAQDQQRLLLTSKKQPPSLSFAGGGVTTLIASLGRCGEVETGLILSTAAVNGLLGLGHGALGVPNQLSSAGEGLVPYSFSLCFAADGNGRIAFGDKGDSDQLQTPLETSHQNELHDGIPFGI